jgi:hypothetical protein
MPDVKDKSISRDRSVPLFRTDPPVQNARESLGEFAYRAFRVLTFVSLMWLVGSRSVARLSARHSTA